MRTLFDIVLSQSEILLIGLSLIALRCLITGEDIKESIPSNFFDKFTVYFIVVMWFGIFPVIIQHYQLPQYGLWSYLFSFDVKLGIIVLTGTIVFNLLYWFGYL